MRKPPKGHVWVHIDRLDREDGKVWAIQSDAGYQVASNVVIQAACYTQFFGVGGRTQPKAVIVVPAGCVRLRDGIAAIATGGVDDQG